nr:hypothetical protein [Achromobacter aloeverae]
MAVLLRDIIVIDHNTILLTDELERQLMRQAIEEQFRPRPLRALGKLLSKMVQAVRSPAQRHSGETANA